MAGRMGVLAAGLALCWSSAAIADPVDALAFKTADDLYSVSRVPKDTTRVRARDVGVKYLREHPSDRHDCGEGRATWPQGIPAQKN